MMPSGGQYRHLAVTADRKQAPFRVGGNQPPLRIEVEPEHAAARVGEHLAMAAVGIHAQDVPAQDRGVELAVRADGNVLRSCLGADVDRAQARQARVLRVRTGVPGSGGRVPPDRVKRHGPDAKVSNDHAGNRCSSRERADERVLHAFSSLFCFCYQR
jgi:hypothetical protein